jgi:hypothetical protein
MKEEGIVWTRVPDQPFHGLDLVPLRRHYPLNSVIREVTDDILFGGGLARVCRIICEHYDIIVVVAPVSC